MSLIKLWVFMYGLYFNLLGLNSIPCTIRNSNTTRCWPLLFLSVSSYLSFFIFSSFFLGLLFMGTIHTAPKQPLLLSNSSSFLTLLTTTKRGLLGSKYLGLNV